MEAQFDEDTRDGRSLRQKVRTLHGTSEGIVGSTCRGNSMYNLSMYVRTYVRNVHTCNIRIACTT